MGTAQRQILSRRSSKQACECRTEETSGVRSNNTAANGANGSFKIAPTAGRAPGDTAGQKKNADLEQQAAEEKVAKKPVNKATKTGNNSNASSKTGQPKKKKVTVKAKPETLVTSSSAESANEDGGPVVRNQAPQIPKTETSGGNGGGDKKRKIKKPR